MKIDEKIAFTDHVLENVSRTSKNLSVIAPLRQKVNRFLLLRFYNVYMKSVTHYGFLIYSCTFNTHPKPIFLQYRKKFTLIFFKLQRSSTEELFESSDVLPTQNAYESFAQVFKYLLCIRNIYMNRLIVFFKIKSSAFLLTQSRETGFYELPHANSVKLKKSLKNRGVRLSNHLLGRNFFFVGLKINSHVSKNLNYYIQSLFVAHKLIEVVFSFNPF